MVLGSVEIFGDDWLDKEENSKLCDVLFSWLLNETDLDMTSDRQVGVISYLSKVTDVSTAHALDFCGYPIFFLMQSLSYRSLSSQISCKLLHQSCITSSYDIKFYCSIFYCLC